MKEEVESASEAMIWLLRVEINHATKALKREVKIGDDMTYFMRD